MKYLASICLLAVIIQIALGAWTSANYAALVCADFPSCQGKYWPDMDWINAFTPGAPLENAARVTIQMAHRIGALITSILLTILAWNLGRQGILLVVLLAIQLSLGISNVLAGLPLYVSLLHNAVAALLLIEVTRLTFRLYAKNIHP